MEVEIYCKKVRLERSNLRWKMKMENENEKWKPGMNKNEIVRTSWSFDVSVNSTKQKKKRYFPKFKKQN